MNSLGGSKVLVTGIAGFLGGNLTRGLLRERAEVVGIDTRAAFEKDNGLPSGVKLVEGDITDLGTLRKAGDKFDFMVHLAAIAAPRQCDDDPKRAFDVNVRGTYNALLFALECEAKKFIFPSTAHVYGVSPKYLPTDETHPLALQSVYTTTKIMGESLCQLFNSNHHLPYTTLRLFNVYGPGQTLDYFIPAMIAKARKGLIELKGGSMTKDFVYVEDLVEVALRSLQSEFVGELNVGSGKQTTLETVARYIAKKFGAQLTLTDSIDTTQPTRMQCDPTRAKKVLGWVCKTPLEVGLDMTIESFR